MIPWWNPSYLPHSQQYCCHKRHLYLLLKKKKVFSTEAKEAQSMLYISWVSSKMTEKIVYPLVRGYTYISIFIEVVQPPVYQL